MYVGREETRLEIVEHGTEPGHAIREGVVLQRCLCLPGTKVVSQQKGRSLSAVGSVVQQPQPENEP